MDEFKIGKLNLNSLSSLQPLKNGQQLDQVKGALEKKGSQDKAEIEKAATQFESLLLSQMFQSMWETVPQEGLLTGSREEAMFQDMYRQALADDIAKNNSLGIKEAFIREVSRDKGEGSKEK